MKTSVKPSKAQTITKEVLMNEPFLRRMVHLRAAQIRARDATKANTLAEETLL